MQLGRLLVVLAVAPCAFAQLTLRSSFGAGQELPVDNRGGDEDNISPFLSWSGVPKNAESFVLIFDSSAGADADEATSKTHWVIYDIPKEVNELREELSGNGASDVARLGMKDDAGQAPVIVDPMGSIDGWVDPEIKAMQDMVHNALDESFKDRNRAKEGSNSFGVTHYVGPSAEGATCTFKLYALSGRLELPRGATKEQVTKAMKGKVLAKTTLAAKVD